MMGGIMKMVTKILALVSMMFLLTGLASAQGPTKPPKEMADLAFMVGKWTCKGNGVSQTGTMQPMTGHSTISMKMDGRWLCMENEDNLEGYGKLTGQVLLSYEENSKKWVGTYVDSQSALILQFKGDLKDGKLTLNTEETEMEGMGKMSFEVVYEKKSDKEFVLTVSIVAGGQKQTAMTNTYTKG